MLYAQKGLCCFIGISAFGTKLTVRFYPARPLKMSYQIQINPAKIVLNFAHSVHFCLHFRLVVMVQSLKGFSILVNAENALMSVCGSRQLVNKIVCVFLLQDLIDILNQNFPLCSFVTSPCYRMSSAANCYYSINIENISILVVN